MDTQEFNDNPHNKINDATEGDNSTTPIPPSPSPSPSPSRALLVNSNSPTSPPRSPLVRSVSAPHHSISATGPEGAATHTSSPILHSSSLSALPSKKALGIDVPLLVDGTTSNPTPLSPSSLVLLVDRKRDPPLAKLAKTVLNSISWVEDPLLKSKMLAFFVGSAMGKIPVGDLDVCRNCAQNYAQLRKKYADSPCPIGEITYGYARHRTLLYKYLADIISLPARIHTHASVLRGGPNTQDSDAHTHSLASTISVVEVFLDKQQKWCVVDLVRDIGELYEEGSPQEKAYKKTSLEWEDESPLKAQDQPTNANGPPVEVKKRDSGGSNSPDEAETTKGEMNGEGGEKGAKEKEREAEEAKKEAAKGGRLRSSTTGTTAAAGNNKALYRHSSHASLGVAKSSKPSLMGGAQGSPQKKQPRSPARPEVPTRERRDNP